MLPTPECAKLMSFPSRVADVTHVIEPLKKTLVNPPTGCHFDAKIDLDYLPPAFHTVISCVPFVA